MNIQSDEPSHGLGVEAIVSACCDMGEVKLNLDAFTTGIPFLGQIHLELA